MGRLRYPGLLVFILFVFINASACGSEKELSGKITIWASDKIVEGLKTSAEKYNVVYPKVQIEIVGKEQKDIQADLMIGLPSNQGIPDIVAMSDDKVQAFVRRFPKGFMEVSDFLESDKDKFLKSKISNLTIENKIYGIPWNTEPLAVCYRMDIFESAGIAAEEIKTWQDLIDVGTKLSKGATFKMITTLNEEELNSMLLQQQGDIYVNKEGKLVANSVKNEKAITLIKNMKAAGVLYSAQSLEDLKRVLNAGQAFSLLITPTQARQLIDNLKELRGAWGVMKIPSFEAGGGRSAALKGTDLMVIDGSKNKNLSTAFLKFAMADETTQLMMFNKYSILPSNMSLYDAKEFSQYSSFFRYEKVWELFIDIAKQLPNTIYKNVQ